MTYTQEAESHHVRIAEMEKMLGSVAFLQVVTVLRKKKYLSLDLLSHLFRNYPFSEEHMRALQKHVWGDVFAEEEK